MRDYPTSDLTQSVIRLERQVRAQRRFGVALIITVMVGVGVTACSALRRPPGGDIEARNITIKDGEGKVRMLIGMYTPPGGDRAFPGVFIEPFGEKEDKYWARLTQAGLLLATDESVIKGLGADSTIIAQGAISLKNGDGSGVLISPRSIFVHSHELESADIYPGMIMVRDSDGHATMTPSFFYTQGKKGMYDVLLRPVSP